MEAAGSSEISVNFYVSDIAEDSTIHEILPEASLVGLQI
jgi:hypothetical protein